MVRRVILRAGATRPDRALPSPRFAPRAGGLSNRGPLVPGFGCAAMNSASKLGALRTSCTMTRSTRASAVRAGPLNVVFSPTTTRIPYRAPHHCTCRTERRRVDVALIVGPAQPTRVFKQSISALAPRALAARRLSASDDLSVELSTDRSGSPFAGSPSGRRRLQKASATGADSTATLKDETREEGQHQVEPRINHAQSAFGFIGATRCRSWRANQARATPHRRSRRARHSGRACARSPSP